MLGLSELRDDLGLAHSAARLRHVERLEPHFIPRLRTRTAQDWFVEGLKRKSPIVPIPEIVDLLEDPEKRDRGAIVPILLGGEEALAPGSMQRLTLTPPSRGGRVPACGEQQDNASSWKRLSRATSTLVVPSDPTRCLCRGFVSSTSRSAGRGRCVPVFWPT
ncbi:CoA transferase [Bradyrhizobium zhanjiangense]|uniref:CoA transferase n=1 Tax=Bradyrhizobium zhanjiangense TaxID=1325107 RepID=UPI00100878C8|nr:CoA transferase [Bradyrhizobium zhanjiangense]